MNSIVRAAITYLVVWGLFRLTGKRTFSQMTVFDFALLLIISETTQAALLDQDNSMTNTCLLLGTFIGLELALTWLKQHSQWAERIIDGVPVLLLKGGRPLPEAMEEERIDEGDILASARLNQGLELLDQIKFAILEKSGGISIIPQERA